MKTRTLLPARDEVATEDTGGNDIFETCITVTVPNDVTYYLTRGELMELFLTDSSNNHLPQDAEVLIMKDSEKLDSPVAVPGARMSYNKWEGLDKQDQRSSEYKDNTRVDMDRDVAKFYSREELIIKVKSSTAVDVSQTNFHFKLDVGRAETRK